MSTNCLRNNSDTNISTALAFPSMVILHNSSGFFFQLRRLLQTNVNIAKKEYLLKNANKEIIYMYNKLKPILVVCEVMFKKEYFIYQSKIISTHLDYISCSESNLILKKIRMSTFGHCLHTSNSYVYTLVYYILKAKS